MTPEEIQALSHQEGDNAPPSLEETARNILTRDEVRRARDIRVRLHQYAKSNPDSPDGQRAAQLVSKIDEKIKPVLMREAGPIPATAGPAQVFARNYADAATFGGSNKLADYLTTKAYPEADLNALHASEFEEGQNSPLARASGQIAGFATGGPNLLFKAAGAATKGLRAGAKAGMATRGALGALRGGIDTALALPAAAGIRGGIESEKEGLGRLEDAGAAALKEAKQLPITAPVGGVLGAAASLAKGLRYGHGQTAQDIRTVEELGKGEVAPLKGAKGGYFDSEVMKGAGSDSDVGEVARRAGDRIRGGLNEEFTAAGKDYAQARAEAGESGALARNIDVYELYKKAVDLAKSHRTTNATKRLLETEVIEPLGKQIESGMKLEDFNDFRGKLADLSEPPVTGSTPESRQFGDLAADARGTLKNTALGEVNTNYAQRMNKLEEAHGKMGFRNRTHTDIADPVAAKKAANFVAREGQTSVTSGIQDQDAKALLKLFPQFEQELAAPELLRAQQRLKLGLHASPGGGLHHVGAGLVRHNVEPLLGAVYKYGQNVNKGNPLFQAVLRAMQQEQEFE